jgi:glycosyltransferase involved in cell wall biosynthesis
LIKLLTLHKKIAKVISDNNYDFIIVSPSKLTQAPFLLQYVNKPIYFCQEPLRIVYDPLFNISENLNFFKINYEKLNRKIRKYVDLKNINKAGLVLANSNFSKNNIKQAYGIDAAVCYLGVDTNKFRPLGLKKEYDLLFIGEKSIIEGYDLLEKSLKLFANKPKVKFIERNNKGEGITENELVRQINKAKITVCLSRNEPFGLIPIEAMSCEVAVVSLNEGGLKESVVNNQTGYLVNSNSKEIYEKINKLLSQPLLRKKMGEKARKRVLSNFSWEKSLQSLFKTVEKYEKD